MNSWRPYPLLRLIIPFLAGIITEVFFAPSENYGLLLPWLMVVLLIGSVILQITFSSYRLRWITGILFNFFLMAAGYEIASCHRPANDPAFFGKHPDGFFIAAIAEPPTVNKSGIKTVLEVRFRHENGQWVSASGSAIGYLKGKAGVSSLQYGDHVLFKAGFKEINDNSNPHVFNYARYLKNKGITHRVFAETYGWKLISLKPTGVIRKVAFRVRDRLLNIFRDNHVEGKEFAVAAALLLGYVDDIDAGLRNDYAASGAMHILSVSGMHVGIIYIFLEFTLGFLNRRKIGRFVKAILLLTFIWFYAMVTGLSPCVLRSAAMLSLPILGKSMNRSPDMYNIIAASLLFILAFDPFLILDVGFQLSYLAVTGILILYKPIYDLYITSAWFPDKVWSILAVSIAAQLATLPITLYTFHQFPNYFMLTNVLVVPLSSLIIYIGILLMIVGYIPIISWLCAKAFIFLVWLLNSTIHFIEQLPFSTIKGVFISTPEMFLLYLLLSAGFLFLILRRISFFYLFLITTISLNILFLQFKINRLNVNRLIVFNVNREALYLFNTQDKSVLFYDCVGETDLISAISTNVAVVSEMQANGIFHKRDYWLNGVDRPEELCKSFVPLIKAGNFILFAKSRIFVLNNPIPKSLSQRFDVDLLIISGNPNTSIAEVVKIFHPARVVIDATNSHYRAMKWMKEAEKSGVKCHAVAELGAFQKDF